MPNLVSQLSKTSAQTRFHWRGIFPLRRPTSSVHCYITLTGVSCNSPSRPHGLHIKASLTSSFIGAIMRIRFVSNGSWYWPLYALNTYHTDFTMDSSNPHGCATTPSQVIPTLTISRQQRGPVRSSWFTSTHNDRKTPGVDRDQVFFFQSNIEKCHPWKQGNQGKRFGDPKTKGLKATDWSHRLKWQLKASYEIDTTPASCRVKAKTAVELIAPIGWFRTFFVRVSKG